MLEERNLKDVLKQIQRVLFQEAELYINTLPSNTHLAAFLGEMVTKSLRLSLPQCVGSCCAWCDLLTNREGKEVGNKIALLGRVGAH